MKNLKKISIIIILAWIGIGNSLVLKTGKEVSIKADEVIDDDLVALARAIRIEGRVNGDLYAFAQKVKIENIVNGSIYTGGADIEINTRGCGSILAFCGSLKTDSKIENNLLFFGGELQAKKGNMVNKDLIAFGGKINVDGEVADEVKGGMGRFNLKGKIGRADIQADDVEIDSGATVLGDILIKSEKEPIIHSNAIIFGKVEFKKIEKGAPKRKRGWGIIGFIKTAFFISKIIIGVILIAIFKPFFRKGNEILNNSTFRCLGFGFLTIIVIPVLIVITLLTIVGIPISIFGLFLFLTLIYISSLLFATGLGEWLIRLIKRDLTVSPFISLILGLVIITLFGMIPYLGFFIRLLVLFFGTGIFVLLFHRLWKDSLRAMEGQ